MKTTYRPISKRRLAELRGYVSPGIWLGRAALFLAVIGGFAWVLRSFLVRMEVRSELAWIMPSVVLALGLYFIAGRWTGGPGFRAAVRKDIAGGVAAAHQVIAVDAIEVDEGEDEGPAFFVLTDEGRTLLFSGQYLGPYKRKGFPWKSFEILEAPHSRIFFGLVPHGEKLAPSAKRAPFTWEEFKRYRRGVREYGMLDVDFQTLKNANPSVPA